MSNFPTTVSDGSLRIAASAGKRTKHRNTPVRRAFIRRASASEPSPPMVRMLRGGRGGAVRLKLYLAMIWVAGGGKKKFDTAIPARAWADLLDLEDSAGNGARRVADAIAWLKKHEFIQTIPEPGKALRTVLLHESGSGRAYPGHPGSRDDPYIKLRSEFWELGWGAVLSGAALATLLLLLDWGGAGRTVWIAPDTATRHYALSEDSRTAGVAELSFHRLITVKRQLVNADLGLHRMRNNYRVNLDRLQEAPGS